MGGCSTCAYCSDVRDCDATCGAPEAALLEGRQKLCSEHIRNCREWAPSLAESARLDVAREYATSLKAAAAANAIVSLDLGWLERAVSTVKPERCRPAAASRPVARGGFRSSQYRSRNMKPERF